MAQTLDPTLDLPVELRLQLPLKASFQKEAQASLKEEQFVLEEYLSTIKQSSFFGKHKPSIEPERFQKDFDTTK